MAGGIAAPEGPVGQHLGSEVCVVLLMRPGQGSARSIFVPNRCKLEATVLNVSKALHMGGEPNKATLLELVTCPFCTESQGTCMADTFVFVQEAVDHCLPVADEPTSPKKAKNIPDRPDLESWFSPPSPEWATVRVIPEEEMAEHNLLAIRVMVTSDASSWTARPLVPRQQQDAAQGASVTGVAGASGCEVSLPLLRQLGHHSPCAAPAGQPLPKKGGREKLQVTNGTAELAAGHSADYSIANAAISLSSSRSELESDFNANSMNSEVSKGQTSLPEPSTCPSPVRRWASLAKSTVMPEENPKTSKVADGFPLLSGKKPGLHWKDSSASCQSGPGEDHSQTQLASYKKPSEDTRGHFKPHSPVFQRKEKAREMPEDIHVYVPHCPFQSSTRGSLWITPGNGTLAADFSEPEDIDDDAPPALSVNAKGALRSPDAVAREHTAGQPKSPLRLIANVIKRSILEPLTSSPEGLKQDSDSKAKASSEQAFFSFPSIPSYSLSQRNSNNNRANNTQPQELKGREWAGEYLGNGSPPANHSHFSVDSEKRSLRDYSEEVSFPVYSPHTRPSKMTSIPQKSSCTRMEDVPGLLEKFTFKETSPGTPTDDTFVCNEKYLLLSSPEPKKTSKDNLGDSAQKANLGLLFDRPRSKVRDREGNFFVSSLPSVKDRSPEDRLRYPSTGCEHLPVRKQASEYSTSSSDDEFESKPSLTHKAKRTLRRRRKLEKETKQLIKQEELKRLHKAQAIQRQLEELEERQRALEIFGVKLERELRGESDSGAKDETQMLHEWFELVLEKNKLMRYESELLIIAQELELEDHQSRLEQKLREKMAIDDSLKDEMDLNEENEIFAEMMKVVEERDKLVSTLEEQRVKEKAEDQHFESIILSRGYQLSRI
ncbi:PREDICTED: MICAL C-terminal-like protein [Phaethon lepturus]|uniref:MICAL C-terminal-like protein n=1 Tax=Phaethon lepturus TaxID=97097 RepID=UPI000530A31E|nr:PREDICTED: MICAL C-terminal-like protein [Phaethon lepturus]